MPIVNVQGVLQTGATPADGSPPQIPGIQPLSWPVGSGGYVRIAVVDSLNGKVNLTGGSLAFCLRTTPDDPSPLINRAGTLTDPTNGIAIFLLSPADTSALARDIYRYDVWFTDSLGTRTQLVPASNFSIDEAELRIGEAPTFVMPVPPLQTGQFIPGEVQASSTGPSSCSFPGARLGDIVAQCLDIGGNLNASLYFETIITVNDQIQQTTALPSADVNLVPILLVRGRVPVPVPPSPIVSVANAAALSALPTAGFYQPGQQAMVVSVPTLGPYAVVYLLQVSAQPADGVLVLATADDVTKRWLALNVPSQRVTMVSDPIDFRTLGNYPLRGCPNAPTKRFLLLSGRLIVTVGTDIALATGITLNPGLVIGGVLTYRLASQLSLSAAVINQANGVGNPVPVGNFFQVSSTPCPVLDLTGLAATPMVNVSAAVTGGTQPSMGIAILDGILF